MPSMPCVRIAAAWSLLSRNARRPPWTDGCSVFTRPSIISGKLVISETSRTVRPASRSALAVPPVEISVTPCPARPLAKSISPVLSDTDSRAREILRRDMATAPTREAGDGPLLPLHDGIEKGQRHTCTQRIGDRNQVMPSAQHQVIVAGHPRQVHHHDDGRQDGGARHDDEKQ